MYAVHRDMKPHNIMLQERRDQPCGYIAKIIDFGFSKEVGDKKYASVSTEHRYTRLWAPKEILQSKTRKCVSISSCIAMLVTR